MDTTDHTVTVLLVTAVAPVAIVSITGVCYICICVCCMRQERIRERDTLSWYATHVSMHLHIHCIHTHITLNAKFTVHTNRSHTGEGGRTI